MLSRPPGERAREHRYRFAQSLVFGLPVIALEFFGAALGGPEARRWVGLMQALLAAWVWYVGAAGMLFEGGILLARHRRVTPDFGVAMIASALYLWSAIAWGMVLARAGLGRAAMRFDAVVILLAAWTGIQSFRWRRAERREAAR